LYRSFIVLRQPKTFSNHRAGVPELPARSRKKGIVLSGLTRKEEESTHFQKLCAEFFYNAIDPLRKFSPRIKNFNARSINGQ